VRLEASHFLWKMVRRIVGVLVRIGTGDLPPEEAVGWLESDHAAAGRSSKGRALLQEGDAGPAKWTAPPSGLFLERVVYPGEESPGPIAPAVPVAAEP
jgi:tRNA pseudouridine38-40 synthase